MSSPSTSTRRLLILACAATKSHDPGLIPAYIRYDGRSGERSARQILMELAPGSPSCRHITDSAMPPRRSLTMTHGSPQIWPSV